MRKACAHKRNTKKTTPIAHEKFFLRANKKHDTDKAQIAHGKSCLCARQKTHNKKQKYNRDST